MQNSRLSFSGVPCYSWALTTNHHMRVKFTPSTGAEGGLLKQARIAWVETYIGNGDFFIRINDSIAGSFSDTGTLTNTPGEWQVVDVSGLNFIIPNHNFYIEVHNVGDKTKGILRDTSPSSSRSENFASSSWHVIQGIGPLEDTNNIGIRAVTAPLGPSPDTNGPPNPDPGIPEFPTVALPVIAVIGLMFLFQRRKGA